MLNRNKIFGSLAGLGFCLALTTSSAFPKGCDTEPAVTVGQFQKIEQPLSLKLAVALGGLSLITAELWWFIFSQTKSHKAQIKQGIQEVNIGCSQK